MASITYDGQSFLVDGRRIWLAGGTAAKLVEALRSPVFSQGFLNKGRLGAVLEPIPITAITDPGIGLFSAACRARMLVG